MKRPMGDEQISGSIGVEVFFTGWRFESSWGTDRMLNNGVRLEKGKGRKACWDGNVFKR